jgi:hypothetical protein
MAAHRHTQELTLRGLDKRVVRGVRGVCGVRGVRGVWGVSGVVGCGGKWVGVREW